MSQKRKKKERNKTEVDELDSTAFSILPAGGPFLTLRNGMQVYFDKYNFSSFGHYTCFRHDIRLKCVIYK